METNWSWIGNWSEIRSIISPNKLAIFDNNTKISYTYIELDKRANKLANYLNSEGIVKGDRIAVFSKNRIENIDLFHATAKLGAIMVPFTKIIDL